MVYANLWNMKDIALENDHSLGKTDAKGRANNLTVWKTAGIIPFKLYDRADP